MPTLNEYRDEYGYFIRARPSGADSPITYQIKAEGYPIVESYGLSHQDEISWDTIQTLKSLGLITTNQSGTIGFDDFEPDADQLDKTALSEQEARELLETIQENRTLSPDQLQEICSILGIEPTTVEEIDVTIPLNQEQIDTIESIEPIQGDLNLTREQLALFIKTMDAIDESDEVQGIETEEKVGEAAYEIVTHILSS